MAAQRDPLELAQEWLRFDKNPDTRAEIERLVSANDVPTLRKILCSRMAFGTAGLRGRMGAGYACMNDLTVQQATQGLCVYLEKMVPTLKQKGVVVGFDARHHSHEFARITAAVFLSRGVPVYLFPDICATPLVPFCMTTKGCVGGVMVTASHNPKQDNGYKVYWGDGSQIIPPHDTGISEEILANLAPWDVAPTLCDNHPLCRNPVAEGVLDLYFEQLSKVLSWTKSVGEDPLLHPTVKFAYTAMHGVGYRFVRRMLEAFGTLSSMVPVAEQVEPDPNFPLVSFPNPEERGALKFAMTKAQEAGCNLVFATDPDADRCAVAERQADGTWRHFQGNDIGFALAMWRWRQWRALHPHDDPSRCAMVSSTVSSRCMRAVAQKEGFHWEDTLTGFKWLGTKSHALSDQGYTVLCAFEESIGYMASDLIREKDGVTMCGIMSEMASWLANQGKRISDFLEDGYKRYGVHVTQNGYYIITDPTTIPQLFQRLRTGGPHGSYIDTARLDGREFHASGIRDLSPPGYDSSTVDHKPKLPLNIGGEMITYTFENGASVTLRTSGTEPKLKFYSEIVSPYPTAPKDELDALMRAVFATLLEPEKNKLRPQ